MARRDARQHVELVEEDGSDPLAPSAGPAGTSPGPDASPGDPLGIPADPGPPGTRPTWGARRRLVTAGALVAVVAAAAIVSQVVTDAQDRARVALVAGQWGAGPLLDGPPRVLWTMPADDFPRQLRTESGVLVGTFFDGRTPDGFPDTDAPMVVRGVDAATGTGLWEVELLDPPDRNDPDDAVPDNGWCEQHPTDPVLVVCFANDSRYSYTQEAPTRIPATERRLVVIDTSDGSVVADLTDAAGAADTATVAGGLVVLTTRGDEDLTVTALHPDGTRAWTRTLPAPPSQERFVGAVGDRIGVVAAGTLTLLDPSGEEVVSTPRGDDGFVGIAPVGVVIYPDGRDPQDTARHSTLIRADGSRTTVGGELALPRLDDGSAPDLLLSTDGSTLRAWDRDGVERWAATVAGASAVLVLDGRVHVSDGDDVLTFDARTGDELWRHDGRGLGEVWTDGRHVLTSGPGEVGRGFEVLALDRSDGSVVWRGPLPGDVISVSARRGMLVAEVTRADGSGMLDVVVLG